LESGEFVSSSAGTEIPAADPGSRTMQSLERAARAGAISLGGTYAVGFVIVNLHHAMFGIPDLSLLRARVVGAGFLFLLMTILPVVGIARAYGLLGLGDAWLPFRTKPEDDRIHNVIVALAVYQLCYGFALSTNFLFEFEEGNGWAQLTIIPAVTAHIVAIYIAYHHPWKCAGLLASAAIALAWSAWVGWGRGFFARSIWFYACALTMLWLRKYAGKPEELKRMRLEAYVGLPFTMLLFFSTIIYGSAKPHFGGGAPIQVLVHLGPDLSKIFGSEALTAWLIEQTDDAIYILRTRSSREAILLPRSQIRAVEFNYMPPKPTAKQ
jgi:hypothetical protein